MLRALVSPALGVVYDVVFKKDENKPVKARIFSFFHAFVLGIIAIVVSQQVTRLYDLHAIKVSEYDRDLAIYNAECPYFGISAARLKECRDANITINSWPIARATSQLVREWPSCFIAPCGELVSNGTHGLAYKIAIAFFLFCVAMYLFNFINCVKKKSKEGLDKYRLKETNKAMIKMQDLLEKQYNISPTQ